MLRQFPKGMILSALFVGLLCGFWPLRLPRYYAGFVTLLSGWAILGIYSTCSSQLIRNPKTERPVSKWWFVLTVPAALAIVSLAGTAATRASGFRIFINPSTSMEPTIQLGDRFLVDTRAYRFNPPQYQDVVVSYRDRDQLFIVKRVIGMGGDTLAGRTDTIEVNNSLINESYIQHSRTPSEINWVALGYDSTESFGPVTVPAGKYFVMGDNRDVSIDSRSSEFGFIDRRSIIGKVLYVYRSEREGVRIR